ncbi:hypothetical protein Q9233_015120 [Columba guinea]|nr:hypothetical protein Q9233_015120 [Columba guinea]
MERAEAYGFSAAMSGAFLLSCLLFAAVNRRQRGPYMDEAFHVPQAQAYCHGRFLQWDPMITTLPGLYLLSVGAVKPVAWLLGWTGSVVCSVGMLRFVNLLFSAGNLYLLYLLLSKIHQKNKENLFLFQNCGLWNEGICFALREKVFICLARYKSSCAYVVHSCAVLSSMSIDTGCKIPGVKPEAIPVHHQAQNTMAWLATIILEILSHGTPHQLPSLCALGFSMRRSMYPPDEAEDQDEDHRQ